MKEIEFEFAFCFMSDYIQVYSRNIQILKPFLRHIHFVAYENYLREEIIYVNDLIAYFILKENNKREDLAPAFAGVSCKNIYIDRRSHLLGFKENKKICDIFHYFGENKLKFISFYNFGGASLRSNGFIFCVYPNERIHEHLPHVHVLKNGKGVRYSLIDFKRFSKDKVDKDHLHAEKKIIIPFIRENQKELLGYWRDYQNGYIPPVLDDARQQYYPASD